MAVIYLTEYNCQQNEVTFENNGCVKVQKIEDISNNEYIIYCVKPMRIFLGKSESCMMTALSGLSTNPCLMEILFYLK